MLFVGEGAGNVGVIFWERWSDSRRCRFPFLEWIEKAFFGTEVRVQRQVCQRVGDCSEVPNRQHIFNLDFNAKTVHSAGGHSSLFYIV
jgi:hypothetical protein